MVEKRRDLEHAAETIEQLFADLWHVFPFSLGLRRGFRPQVDVYRTGIEDPLGVEDGNARKEQHRER